MKIGFIGCGNIATAIIGGAVGSGFLNNSDVFCFDTNIDKSKYIAGMYAITAFDSAEQIAKQADILFLTVKPQVYKTVIEGIRAVVNANTCIVDVAAGMSISTVKQYFGFECKVIRVMPNTPIMYLQGATALVKGSGVLDSEFEYVKGIFESGGKAVEVDELMMDTVTGISGSSPAFFMRYMREIIKVGVNNGMDYETAKTLVTQTMLGTAKMVEQSDLSLDTLIKNVASPGGTTEAGLNYMEKNNFDNLTNGIIESAVNRSIELSKK